MKINDIANGVGPKYILLTKTNGVYKIHCSADKMKDIQQEVNEFIELIEEIKGQKLGQGRDPNKWK